MVLKTSFCVRFKTEFSQILRLANLIFTVIGFLFFTHKSEEKRARVPSSLYFTSQSLFILYSPISFHCIVTVQVFTIIFSHL